MATPPHLVEEGELKPDVSVGTIRRQFVLSDGPRTCCGTWDAVPRTSSPG